MWECMQPVNLLLHWLIQIYWVIKSHLSIYLACPSISLPFQFSSSTIISDNEHDMAVIGISSLLKPSRWETPYISIIINSLITAVLTLLPFEVHPTLIYSFIRSSLSLSLPQSNADLLVPNNNNNN